MVKRHRLYPATSLITRPCVTQEVKSGECCVSHTGHYLDLA
jgi:hypothetical protein